MHTSLLQYTVENYSSGVVNIRKHFLKQMSGWRILPIHQSGICFIANGVSADMDGRKAINSA